MQRQLFLWGLRNLQSSAYFQNAVINSLSSLYAPVFNFTNMHPMSHRSDFCLACSSKVNIKNQLSSLQYRIFGLSLKPNYTVFKLLPPSGNHNLSVPRCWRLGYLQLIKVCLLVIWTTLLFKSSLMPGGLQWRWAANNQLLVIIRDMGPGGDSIFPTELRRPAALASDVSCVIKFFAIHQNMGPSQWGITCWQKRT